MPTSTASPVPTDRWRHRWESVRFPVMVFIGVAAWLILVSWFSIHHLDRHPRYPIGPVDFPGSWLLEGWFRWDGGWYERIARTGYLYQGLHQQSSVAYFPAYPLAMRVMAVVVRNSIVSGIAITFVSGLGAAVLVYRWTLDQLGEAAARTTVVLLLVFPYAWYLVGAVYADALFLVALLAAFVLLEGGHPIWAGLAGAVATGARPMGLAVVLGLVAVTIQRRGGLRRLRSLRPGDAGVLLSAGGLVGWAGYQWWRWGNPLIWVDIENAPGWEQGQGPHTWFKLALIERVRQLPGWLGDSFAHTTVHSQTPWSESTYTVGAVAQGLLLLGMLVLVVAVVRRLGWGYGVYAIAALLMPLLGTKDFQGVGRYLLAVFPCFAVLACVLNERPRLRFGLMVTSAAALTLLTSAYARGYYLA